MRFWLGFILVSALATPSARAQEKLTTEDRVEILRGMMAEFATVKQLLPRSKKPLPFESSGTWDKAAWEERAKEFGPAGRVGDLVQISKVDLDKDSITLEINGGFRGGRKWYERVEVGMGTSGRTYPVGQGSNAPGGTSIVIQFHKPLAPIKAAEIKKMLAPVLDFEKRSATEIYAETLPPEVQKAIKENKVIEGMNREQVVMALGRPVRKTREVKDDLELED